MLMFLTVYYEMIFNEMLCGFVDGCELAFADGSLGCCCFGTDDGSSRYINMMATIFCKDLSKTICRLIFERF
jgi:hypothetical protein